MKAHLFALALGFSTLALADNPIPEPVCHVESSCIQSFDKCRVSSPEWGPSYYYSSNDSYDSDTIRSNGYVTYIVKENMACVAYNGTIARFTTTKRYTEKIASGDLIDLGHRYTIKRSDEIVTNILSLREEYLEASKASGQKACERAYPYFVESQTARIGTCAQAPAPPAGAGRPQG